MKIIDRVQEHYRGLKPSRFALAVISAPFLALGWLAGLIVRAVWFVGAWAWAALVVGFRAARGS